MLATKNWQSRHPQPDWVPDMEIPRPDGWSLTKHWLLATWRLSRKYWLFALSSRYNVIPILLSVLCMEVLAVIPARGGSQGIPRKNLKQVAGKSLLEHSIVHAHASKLVSRTIVSTEDDEIATVALGLGAEVPFRRPIELADHHVLDYPVFEHLLRELARTEDYQPDIVVHLRPTAPLRKAGWIDAAINLLVDDTLADSVRSVSEPSMHPYRMFSIDSSGYLDPVMKHEHPEPYLLRSQDLPVIYYYNCVIDVTRPKTILEQKSMTGNKILPFYMNPDEVFDVDSLRDLDVVRLFAETFHK